MSKNYFRLFSTCQLVDGIKSSLIYDLHRGVFYPLDKNYSNLVKRCYRSDINTINAEFGCYSVDFFNIMIEKEVGFFTYQPEAYPALPLNYKDPSLISTAIIEVSSEDEYSVPKVLDQLIVLGCKKLLLIITNDKISFEALSSWIRSLDDSFVVELELILPIAQKFPFLNSAINENNRIISILFYGAKKYNKRIGKNRTLILEIEGAFNYGEVINKDYFFTNVKMFVEARNYNIGLNKKVSICSNGDIKNYPTHKKIVGNINDKSILEVIDILRKDCGWSINNDMIEYCQSCKYRYCCLSTSEVYSKEGKYYKMNYCESKLWKE